MSSLRSTTKSIINNITPSPTLKSRVNIILSACFLKRISLRTFFGRLGSLRASMTVEAAVLLPMVIFFFLHIMSFVEMLRLHGQLSFALWECGNQLTVYTAMSKELEEKVPDMAVSYLYVGNRVKSFLGRDYMDNSPIVGGSRGLQYLSSTYENDCVDIGVTYQVRPKLTLFPFPYMRMVNRYYGRSWSGYDVEERAQYVYVTLYGEVWHAVADCTHIFITVQETAPQIIGSLRNEAGGKYTICQHCKDDAVTQVVYYTPQGSRYHNSRDCPALTRYIRAIVWQENLPYRPCSRCVKEEGM